MSWHDDDSGQITLAEEARRLAQWDTMPGTSCYYDAREAIARGADPEVKPEHFAQAIRRRRWVKWDGGGTSWPAKLPQPGEWGHPYTSAGPGWTEG